MDTKKDRDRVVELNDKLPEFPELPDNFVVLITGPSLTYKKKLIASLECKGFLKIPSFTTKPKTYEAQDFYVRVKEKDWEETVKENFVCKTVVHGYKYALNWITFQSMLKTRRPIIVSLDQAGIHEFCSKLVPKLKGLVIINILCHNRDVLNMRLAEYSRKYKQLSNVHVSSLAYRLLDDHLSYEQLDSGMKIFLLHNNNIEETSQTVVDEIVAAHLESVPLVEITHENTH
jgi:hypothetical protein